MDHIFGPVNSRRLGMSLGIDLLSDKVCNYDCIYCEVGPTRKLTCERAEYVPTGKILSEIDSYCRNREKLAAIDVITVTASGEPTLHSGFGRIVAHLKDVAEKPVAVLTNGSTLHDPQVRREMALADIVIPSLDAARPSSFRRINRPARCLDLEKIIEGLATFSHEFQGHLWLEILLARGINDSSADIEALCRITGRMRLERIQLNTVARPPLESFARPVAPERLQEIAARFGAEPGNPAVDLLARQGQTKKIRKQSHDSPTGDVVEEIVQMVQRRPCTADDIDSIFKIGGPKKVEHLLEPLVRQGRLQLRSHGDRLYYQGSGSGTTAHL
ncbi:radical SAM protein [Desulfolithobacter sp.]